MLCIQSLNWSHPIFVPEETGSFLFFQWDYFYDHYLLFFALIFPIQVASHLVNYCALCQGFDHFKARLINGERHESIGSGQDVFMMRCIPGKLLSFHENHSGGWCCGDDIQFSFSFNSFIQGMNQLCWPINCALFLFSNLEKYLASTSIVSTLRTYCSWLIFQMRSSAKIELGSNVHFFLITYYSSSLFIVTEKWFSPSLSRNSYPS